jgi:hypothetical protein
MLKTSQQVCIATILCAQFLLGDSALVILPPKGDLASHVSLVAFGAPQFDQELREVLPLVHPELTPILPYSVVVRNVSAQSLVMTSVLFEVEDLQGAIKQYSLNTLDLAPSSPAHLQPDRRRFVSMSGPANRVVNAGRLDLLSGMSAVPLSKVASDLHAKRRITVTIDGIITSQGIFIGPDKTNALRRIQEERRAQVWVASRLTPRLDTAQVKKELVAMQGVALGPDVSLSDRDFYNLRVKQLGRQLAATLDRSGLDAVMTAVSRWQREIVIKRQ